MQASEDSVDPAELTQGVVHVWWVSPSAARHEHLRDLTDAERQRHSSLRREEDQNRFLAACTLLRRCAGAYLGAPPAQVPVDRSCPTCDRPHGKPVVTGTGLEVSLSHSGERVALAVALGTPLGVDVEELQRRLDVDGLARSALTDREAAALAGVPEQRRSEAFLNYWTRKEAVLKATGEGLRVPLEDVEVSGPDEAPRLLRWHGRSGAAATISLSTLDPGPGYVAHLAVVGDGGEVSVVQSDGTALLAG